MPYRTPAPLVNDFDMVASYDMTRTAISTSIAINGPAASGGTYSTTNLAMYIPFWIATQMTVTQFFLQTVTASGNVDMGIYDTNFTRLVSSGSTAAAAPLTVADITDYSLARGNYYLAIACDNTTISVRRHAPGAAYTRPLGLLMQLSAFPLPATATPVATNQGTIPIFGFTTRSAAL